MFSFYKKTDNNSIGALKMLYGMSAVVLAAVALVQAATPACNQDQTISPCGPSDGVPIAGFMEPLGGGSGSLILLMDCVGTALTVVARVADAAILSNKDVIAGICQAYFDRGQGFTASVGGTDFTYQHACRY